MANRPSDRGQGAVKHPESDKRLKESQRADAPVVPLRKGMTTAGSPKAMIRSSRAAGHPVRIKGP
jgi:hypothetical protein